MLLVGAFPSSLHCRWCFCTRRIVQALQQTQPGGQHHSSTHNHDHHQRHQHQHQHQASRRSLELEDPGADNLGGSPPATGGGGGDSGSSSRSSRMSRSGGSSSSANEHMSVGKGASDAVAASSNGGLHGVMELGGASFQVTFLPASSGAPHDLSQAAVRRPGEAALY